MKATNPALPTRLLGLALIGVGLIGLVETATVSLLARSLQIGWAVLLLPAGIGLVRGAHAWAAPLLGVMQVWAIAMAVVVIAASFWPEVPFFADGARVDMTVRSRAVVISAALLEAGLWVWVLGLGRRLVALLPTADSAALVERAA